MHVIFGERERAQSARAILADLELAPWNHDDWKEIQPRYPDPRPKGVW